MPNTAGSPSRHTLCGPPSHRGAISPNTNRPLLPVACLDPSDPRLEITECSSGTIPLLYSWTCAVSEGELTYRFSKDDIEVLSAVRRAGSLGQDFPYENYPMFFPSVELELHALNEGEQALIQRMNRRTEDTFDLENQFPHLAAPRSQVGGQPRLMQWPLASCSCPSCGAQMPLLAAIGNENASPRGFTDNAFVQMLFFLCAPCSIVTGYNICD